ncbi:hypothetical protein XaplCFBP3123_10870 [Xanthomonas arboricola pv. populi]|nr:hypothetical protein XaplCFBP3123_10870 [Xanthomonas arboricola pv. populi]
MPEQVDWQHSTAWKYVLRSRQQSERAGLACREPSVASARSMPIGSIGSPMPPAYSKYGSGSARGEANG